MNRKVYQGGARGGVGVFLKKELKKYVKIRYDLSNENFLWCKILKEYLGYPEDLYLCVVYIPPECSTREKREKKDHFKILKDTISKINGRNIVLMGDFNARTLTFEDTLLKEKNDDCLPVEFYSKVASKRSNQDLTGNKYGQKLTDFCISSGMYIANGRTLGDLQGKITCYQTNGSSTVDYSIVSENMHRNVGKFQVMDPSISDHCPISMEIKSTHSNIVKNQNTTTLPPTIKWNETTQSILKQQLESKETLQTIQEVHNLLGGDNNNNIDIAVEKLNYIFNINRGGGSKRPRNTPKRQKKWYDKTCKELAKELKITAKLLSNAPTNPFLRGSFCKKRKEFKRLVKRKKTEWRSSMISKLEEMENQDPKEYWKLIKELRDNKKNEAEFDTDKFTSFFEKLYSLPKNGPEQQKITDLVQQTLENASHTFEDRFTLEELIKAIKRLKNNKSAGPDRIIAEMLKASTPEIMLLILKIMNKIRTTFQYPTKWGIGITSLLFKEGDDDDPGNYRAITVTDTLAKVLAILINERMETWSKENNIIRDEQIGFEKKTRSADHLFVLKTIMDKYKSEGKKVYACFIDFQKAFDSVWRTGLLYKLIKSGLNMNTIKLIKNMYEKTSQTLKLNGGISKLFRTYKGVRQGCILSPKLFNLFINDIPNIFDNSCCPVTIHDKVNINCLMYADDLVLLSETASGLQSCLYKLHQYTEKWGLKLNLKKTKIMIFQNQGKRKTEQFIFGSQIVQHADEYKYLGTIITYTGNFKLNEVNLKKKGLRASFLIFKQIGRNAKPSSAIKIFEKVVEPILLYNCEITGACIPKSWNKEKFTKKMWDTGSELNKVVLGYLRQILGVSKKTSNIGILSEVGKFPIALKIFQHILRYWKRISSTERTLLIAARNANNELQHQGQPNWTRIVNFLLEITAESGEKNNPETNLRQKYIQWWNEQAKPTGTNKLDFYYKHKKCFSYEKYLDNVPLHIHKYITRLRLSCHSFPIEIMRYNKKKINREERICKICNIEEKGDEEHYLLRCRNVELEHIRKNFLQEVRESTPILQNFSDQNIIDYGMILHDERIQIHMATYVMKIMKTFKEESEGTRDIIKSPVKTRTGRLVKKPDKLNL